MTISWLPRVIPPSGEEPEALPEIHPMRIVTLEAALGEGWSPQVAARVQDTFDQIAPEWHTRAGPGRLVPLDDALARGGPFEDGLVVELGSGTGIATPTIAGHFPRMVAVDLSMEMLRRAPALVPRLRGDGSRLPLRDASVSVLVLVNMLLFPKETDRLLSPGGSLVWVNTQGERTPIFLSADEVQRSLGYGWELIASEAGWGTWCVARRAGSGV